MLGAVAVVGRSQSGVDHRERQAHCADHQGRKRGG